MRCATSGRLTPAAATLIRICPEPGFGTGTILGLSTSGPPGALISTAIIVSGISAMAFVPRPLFSKVCAGDLPEPES